MTESFFRKISVIKLLEVAQFIALLFRDKEESKKGSSYRKFELSGVN